MKAESKERGKDRSYPCPLCRSDHTSVTTYLGMIASRPLMSWMGKNGTAKLNVFADTVKAMNPELFKEAADAAREQWECTEDTQFWKSAKQIGQDAADIGTLTHGWIEAHINGKEVTMDTLPPQAQAAVRGFLEWEKAHHVEYVTTEQTFYNCALDYAGTADCVAKVDGELSMLDWKTAKGVYANYVVQDWLYALADESQHGDRLYRQVIIGRFGKDGTWEAPVFKRNGPVSLELSKEVLIGCRAIFRMNKAWDETHPYVPKPKKETIHATTETK